MQGNADIEICSFKSVTLRNNIDSCFVFLESCIIRDYHFTPCPGYEVKQLVFHGGELWFLQGTVFDFYFHLRLFKHQELSLKAAHHISTRCLPRILLDK
jgi:hypothetical protein